MDFIDTLKIVGATFVFDRPAAKHTLSEWAATLETSGVQLLTRFKTAADTPKNRDLLAHTIGIERWSQRRLRVALGDRVPTDEYDGYRPATSCTFDDLQKEFEQTRLTTVGLVRQLVAAGAAPYEKIRHNEWGPISLAGWLRYMVMHSNFETRGVA